MESCTDEVDDSEDVEEQRSLPSVDLTAIEGNKDLKNAAEMLDSLVSDSLSLADIEKSELLHKLRKALRERKEELKCSRTATLWLQYLDMINILQQFLRAERTGNWNLHLHALSEMLPNLASSGHNLYLKSVYQYLQKMSLLEHEHPNIY